MKKWSGAVILGLAASSVQGATPSLEEMWALVQAQQVEITRLKQQLAQADSRIEETVVKVEATADVLESRVESSGSRIAAWTDNTRLGGYAEMHYNKLENDRRGGADKDELDMHRFVMFLSHDFSERTRFFSEMELEHSLVEGGEESGEYELEQAYIEHDLNDRHRLKAGLFLVPVGLLNETHEPDTFYGVERNAVENRIIPTTWWEGGIALSGQIAPGFSYDAAFTSGLGLDAQAGQWSVRDGRQKVAEADASNPAYTLRLKYTGVAGLELASTLQYQTDLYQGEFARAVDGWLFESHVAYSHGPFSLRALYANWDIDDVIESFKAGADQQQGWYVEPAWRIGAQWGVFARYSEWDNQAGTGLDTAYDQWNLGLNYWLEENVVFKLDYQKQDAPEGKDQLDGLNLGVGWSF